MSCTPNAARAAQFCHTARLCLKKILENRCVVGSLCNQQMKFNIGRCTSGISDTKNIKIIKYGESEPAEPFKIARLQRLLQSHEFPALSTHQTLIFSERRWFVLWLIFSSWIWRATVTGQQVGRLPHPLPGKRGRVGSEPSRLDHTILQICSEMVKADGKQFQCHCCIFQSLGKRVQMDGKECSAPCFDAKGTVLKPSRALRMDSAFQSLDPPKMAS